MWQQYRSQSNIMFLNILPDLIKDTDYKRKDYLIALASRGRLDMNVTVIVTFEKQHIPCNSSDNHRDNGYLQKYPGFPEYKELPRTGFVPTWNHDGVVGERLLQP